MTLALAPARPEDAAVLGDILQDWLEATPWMPVLHRRDETRAFLAGLVGAAEVTVVRGEGPLGFLARDGEVVRALYLAPAARGQGIGGRLLAAAQAAAPRLRLWTFEANGRARAFYARHGFVEGRRTGGDNAEGLPDVEMTWARRPG